MIDPVTKLPDRWEFKKTISLETNRAIRHGHSVGIFLLDLDDFASKTSNLSEEKINILLYQIAEALRSCIRTSDYLARISWDRFGILAFVKSPSDALIVGEKIHNSIMNRVFTLNGLPIQLSLSIGFTVSPEDGQVSDFLFEKAERALERAKKRGKNQFDYLSKWDSIGRFPPLIGRSDTISHIVDSMKGSQVVIITGDDGIGKTRILLELEEIARNLGYFIIGPHYFPIKDYPLAPILGGIVREYIETGKTITTDLKEAFPYLFAMLKDLGAPLEKIVSPSYGRTVSRYYIVVRAMGDLIANLLKNKPVLMLIDDGEEIDSDSLSLLSYLTRRFTKEEISIVIASKNVHPDFEKIPHSRISIKNFNINEVRAFLLNVGDKRFPMSETKALKLTEGNPFYLTIIAGAYQLTGRPPENTINAIDKIRLSFSHFDREIITAAIITGKVVDDEGVSELTGVSVFQVYESLEKLKQIGLVIERYQRFMFLNRYFMDNFVKSTQKERLKSYYLQLAEYYMDRAIDSPLYKLLSAKFYRKVGKRERALSLELQAAQQLNQAIGAKSVVPIYEKPLASVLSRHTFTRVKRFISVFWDYIWLLHSQHEYTKELEILSALEMIAEKIGDSDLLFDVILHRCMNVMFYLGRYNDCVEDISKIESLKLGLTTEKKSDFLYLKGVLALNYSRPEDAVSLLSRSLSEAMKVTDPYRTLRTLYALGTHYLLTLDLKKSLSYSASGLKLAAKIKHKPQQGTGFGIISDVYRTMGVFEKALRYAVNAEKTAHETGDLRTEWRHMLRQARILANLGKYELSHKQIDKAESLVNIFGSHQNIVTVYLEMLNIFLDRRLPKQADKFFNKIYWKDPVAFSVQLRKRYLMTLANLHYWNSRYREANRVLNSVLKMINNYHKKDLIEYYELKARVEHALGNLKTALKFAKSAYDLVPHRYFTLSPRWTLYEILQALGKPEARSYLKELYNELHKLARSISNKDWRISFLEQVPQNAIILREAEKEL